MTIGIAAFGPRAGLAVFMALRAVERVARGAVCGFASFVAITTEGEVLRAETQRGGTRTLFVDAEITGLPPPPRVAEAPFAGVMSSGPDRPAPLCQFTPADGAVGLVTGHRLPNTPGCSGVRLNEEVLALMREGLSPQGAVERVLADNPGSDAGMIALDWQGRLFAANSAFVADRADLRSARRDDPETSARVAVLHNAIHPPAPMAALAAPIAMDIMAPGDRSDDWLTVRSGLRLAVGTSNAVVIDAERQALEIRVTTPGMLEGRRSGAPIGYHASVIQDGRTIGSTVMEPYVVLDGGIILSLSGQTELKIPFRRV